jgi:hypothetical protein
MVFTPELLIHSLFNSRTHHNQMSNDTPGRIKRIVNHKYTNLFFHLFLLTSLLFTVCSCDYFDSNRKYQTSGSIQIIATTQMVTSTMPSTAISLAAETPVNKIPTKTTAYHTITSTPTATPFSLTSTSRPTASPTVTTTPTLTPTYSILRGQVIPDRANCRYGPGWPYLYKYGLVGGSNLEIIGRNELGTWVLIRAIGGTNPCWVKAALMDIGGDVFTVQPVSVDIIQAWSPYYAPLTGVSAHRVEGMVIISWHPLQLRAGDDSEQVPYIVETWTCQDGQIVFNPVGVYLETAEVLDEPGCSEPSHGQVLAAEKHGYTKPVEIPWPQASP